MTYPLRSAIERAVSVLFVLLWATGFIVGVEPRRG
jgi:hypothetical protein